MKAKIYIVKNLINGKLYVGLTTQSLSERFRQHCDRGYALFEAIKKYGKENFNIKLIEEVSGNIDILGEIEISYIKKFKSHVSEHGYNISIGGLNEYIFKQNGRVVSEETKKKMSLNHADVSGENNPRYKKMVILTPENDLILRSNSTQDRINSFLFTKKFLENEKFEVESRNEGFYFEFVENYDFNKEEKRNEFIKKRDDWWYNKNSKTYRYIFKEFKPKIHKQVNIFTDPEGNIFVTKTKREFWDFCYSIKVKPQEVKALREGRRIPFTKRSNFFGWKIKLGDKENEN